MSDIYVQEAIDGGMPDIWGPYEQDQNRLSIGLNTRKVYLDGADLKISEGRVGLNYSSTGYGIIRNSAARVISVAALTASLWAKVELSQVAGTVVTEITSIVGASNPATLPTWTYDALKGGHYLTATKRAIALVWINAAGAVEGIVNEIGGIDGYSGYSMSDDSYDVPYLFEKHPQVTAFPQMATEYVMSKSSNYSLPNMNAYALTGETSKNILILATRGANGFILTLPASASNTGRIVEVYVVDSAAGCCLVKSTGAETISGMAQLFLMEQYQKVRLFCNGSNWQILSGVLFWVTAKNTNDWTNRELGMSYVPWDNPSGVLPIVGEKVTEETSGITAIVTAITGTTTGYITMMYESGLGIFTDNKKLTGSWGNGYVTVNIPGSTSKNADTSMIHNAGRNAHRFTKELWLYAGTTFQWANAVNLPQSLLYEGSTRSGWVPISIDTNNIKFQNADGGFDYLTETGTFSFISSSDYSYCSVMKLVF